MLSIYEQLENLSRQTKKTTFKLIATKLIEMYSSGVFKTQDEISRDCYVAKSTVTKFAQSIKCSGYRELIVLMKVEYQKILTKKKLKSVEQDKKDFINNSIIKWVYEDIDFVKSFKEDLKYIKSVNIVPSFQSMESANFLAQVLLNSNIYSQIIDVSKQNYLIKKLNVFDNSINLIILTGRDNETLLKFIKKNYLYFSQNINYIISTLNQIEKLNYLPQKSQKIITFEGDNSGFFYRHIALTQLFFYIYEIL